MNFLTRLLNRLRQNKTEPEFASDRLDISQREYLVTQVKLSANLDKNTKLIQEAMGYSLDLEMMRFKTGPERIPSAIFYLDGMVDNKDVEGLLRTIKIDIFVTGLKAVGPAEIFNTAREQLLTVVEVEASDNLNQILTEISSGATILFFQGTPRALICATRGWMSRAITESIVETAIRAPKESFVENLRTNTSLLRRRIHTPNLWIENFTVGDLTRTKVGLVYIKGLADEKIVGEVRSRIQGIQIDGILESSYIEDFLQDQPLTVFPLVFRTERPDRVAGALLEGRVAVLTDGTPFALIVPNHLPAMMEGPDDYYEQFPLGAFLRLLRYTAFLTSLFLPGVYVAVINFHPELLPTVLFLRIVASREGIPFPAIVEALIIELIFEVLREAGVRMPVTIGPAISIVGALVLGDAAIRAGLVSPAMVIVVAMTAIASFTVPVFSLGIAARMLRFGVIILGGVFGLFGIQLALILLLIHLCALRSFGLPYMYPLAPLVTEDMKDTLVRLPWWAQVKRPKLVGYREPVRQPAGPRPGRRTGPREERRD